MKFRTRGEWDTCSPEFGNNSWELYTNESKTIVKRSNTHPLLFIETSDYNVELAAACNHSKEFLRKILHEAHLAGIIIE